jgi:Na+-translocating ferredoxin:NAD+ oxidoreductase RnfG subunit
MLKKILKKENIIPVVVLSVICLAIAGLLSIVNMFTSKEVKKAEMNAIRESLSDIMPGAELGDAYVPDGAPDSVVAVYDDKAGAGYVVLIETEKGYTGKTIAITVGIDRNGRLLGAKITKTEETKGVSKVDEFATALKGLDGNGIASVDLVSGVTYSSRAVRDGVLDALTALGFYTPPAPEPEIPAPFTFKVYSFIGWMIVLLSAGLSAAYIIVKKRRMTNAK